MRSAATGLLGLAAGCASTTSFAPPEHCSGAIPAGMARIVASRTSSSLGGAVPIAVHDDNQPIGELGPGGRLCWLRHAGTAHVTGYLPANAPHTGRDIDVEAAAGMTVQIEIGLGTPWTVLRAQR